MNLSNLVDNHHTMPSRRTSASVSGKRPNNLYYLPARLSVLQYDFIELIIRLHKNHLQRLFGCCSANNEPETNLGLSDKGLSNRDLTNLLYSNLNLAVNNPYLLVDHYIPKNMLLMNTKDSLINISGKFAVLNQIISVYEKYNDSSRTRKFNVLVLANSSKELDFIESLLIGRLVNYKRYSGSKLFEHKLENSVKPFSAHNEDISEPQQNSTSSSHLKRSANPKDDPYLVRRLKKQHKRAMTYIANNNYNHNYCLTMHLITVNQLKFQFFTNSNPETNFDFLDLCNTIDFNYIISFNNYLNLDHYYLKKLRAGYIHPTTSRYQRYLTPLPIVCLLAKGSIEHATIAAHDWLVRNKVVNDHANHDRNYIDERPTSFNLNSKDDSILLLIIKLFLLSRKEIDPPVSEQDNALFEEWLLSPVVTAPTSSMFNQNATELELESLATFAEHMHLFKSHFDVSKSILDKPMQPDAYLNSALTPINLKFFEFDHDQSLSGTLQLFEKNKQILDQFPNTASVYVSEDVNSKAKKEFGDTTAAKRLKIEPSASESFLLAFDTQGIGTLLNELKELVLTHESIKSSSLTELVSPTNGPITLDNYKKSLTKLIKARGETLDKLNTVFNTKLYKENIVGNAIQLRVEKNNFISKDVFSKQLELKKSITKEEKYFEKILNDYKRSKQAEESILHKILIFDNYLNTAAGLETGKETDIDTGTVFNESEQKQLEDILQPIVNLKQENFDENEQTDKKKPDDKIKKKEDEDKLKKDAENKAKIDKENRKNEEEANHALEQLKYFFSLNSKHVKLNETTKELEIDESIRQNAYEITQDTLATQDAIIAHLEAQVSDLDSQSDRLSETIEDSRSRYQLSSSHVSTQLEDVRALDAKVTAIKEILAKKDHLLIIKEKALDTDYDPSEAFNKSSNGIAAASPELKWDNPSNYKAIKYQNLVSQKYFLENYMKVLKSCFSSKKQALNGRGSGGTKRTSSKMYQ